MEGSPNGLCGKDWTVMVKINKYTHRHQIIFLLLCVELKIPSELCIRGDEFRFG